MLSNEKFAREGIKYFSDYYKKTDCDMIDPIDELNDTRKAVAHQVNIIDANLCALLDFYKKELVSATTVPSYDIWNALFEAIEMLNGGDECVARDYLNKVMTEEE